MIWIPIWTAQCQHWLFRACVAWSRSPQIFSIFPTYFRSRGSHHYACAFPCPGQQAQMQPPLSCWASLSAAQPSDLLTVQSQVQCCLALTLRHKHWLHASEIHSGCITLITLSWQSILALSLPSPVWRWRAAQNWPSMNCYMISVWSNKS